MITPGGIFSMITVFLKRKKNKSLHLNAILKFKQVSIEISDVFGKLEANVSSNMCHRM